MLVVEVAKHIVMADPVIIFREDSRISGTCWKNLHFKRNRKFVMEFLRVILSFCVFHYFRPVFVQSRASLVECFGSARLCTQQKRMFCFLRVKLVSLKFPLPCHNQGCLGNISSGSLTSLTRPQIYLGHINLHQSVWNLSSPSLLSMQQSS